MGKVFIHNRYRKKTFDTAQYFHSKRLKIYPIVMKNTFLNEKVFQGQSDIFQN